MYVYIYTYLHIMYMYYYVALIVCIHMHVSYHFGQCVVVFVWTAWTQWFGSIVQSHSWWDPVLIDLATHICYEQNNKTLLVFRIQIIADSSLHLLWNIHMIQFNVGVCWSRATIRLTPILQVNSQPFCFAILLLYSLWRPVQPVTNLFLGPIIHPFCFAFLSS